MWAVTSGGISGAVGSTLADSLARQGLRRLRVIDFDRVEARNLATQTYTTDDVGALKVQALKDQIFRATGVEIDAVPKKLTPENDHFGPPELEAATA